LSQTLKQDPWAEFDEVDQRLPDLAPSMPSISQPTAKPRATGTWIVVARKSKPKP